jgi:hypothetical protein
MYCCLVSCGSGLREMPAKRANKPPTNCEVWRLPKPWCKHCQHIKVNKRSWNNISLCTGSRPKNEADPPSYTGLQVYIHVLMCSCAPSDESPAIPEDRADHTDTRMAFQMVCKIQYKLYGICLALLIYEPPPHPSPPPPCSKLHFHAYCRQHEGMGLLCVEQK